MLKSIKKFFGFETKEAQTQWAFPTEKPAEGSTAVAPYKIEATVVDTTAKVVETAIVADAPATATKKAPAKRTATPKAAPKAKTEPKPKAAPKAKAEPKPKAPAKTRVVKAKPAV